MKKLNKTNTRKIFKKDKVDTCKVISVVNDVEILLETHPSTKEYVSIVLDVLKVAAEGYEYNPGSIGFSKFVAYIDYLTNIDITALKQGDLWDMYLSGFINTIEDNLPEIFVNDVNSYVDSMVDYYKNVAQNNDTSALDNIREEIKFYMEELNKIDLSLISEVNMKEIEESLKNISDNDTLSALMKS